MVLSRVKQDIKRCHTYDENTAKAVFTLIRDGSAVAVKVIYIAAGIFRTAKKTAV